MLTMPQLINLPEKLKAIIADLLPLHDLRQLRLTCRTLASACLTIWTRVDRRDHGYSSTILSALSRAQATSFDLRNEALHVIEREIRNGARIDEDLDPRWVYLLLAKT